MRNVAIAVLVLVGALIIGGRARAAELVMFEDPGCAWCRRWHAEIGPSYPLTAEGRAAPLRRIHIRDQATAGVLLDWPITATPTFVLAEQGREVGRIVGYPGEAFFYGLLGNLLKPSRARFRSLRPSSMHAVRESNCEAAGVLCAQWPRPGEASQQARWRVAALRRSTFVAAHEQTSEPLLREIPPRSP